MKQLGELKVKDYMTPQAIVIDDSAQLTEAIRLMEAEKLSVLPVVNVQDKVVGILSASDVLKFTREIQSDLSTLHEVSEWTQEFLIGLLVEQGEDSPVKDVMTKPVICVAEETNMVIVANMLLKHQCHHLPVVDQQEIPIGMIATSDFVRAFADHGATLAG